ncbi:MAG TPA: cytochrome c biogenesis protein CcdA [Clostridiales bacterium]|nr:cytochrome c biogenesis protein CcdA [Clostridiales bacterium]
MDEFFQTLSSLIKDNFWFAPLFALLAGVVNSLMPCCLSTLPLIIAYVSGTSENNPKKALRFSLVYAIGSAVTYTTLGVIASFFGGLIGRGNKWWYIALGVLMVIMALQMWEIFNFIPSTYLQSKSKRTGYLGAFIAGILAGVFSTPCSTPVLVALLAIVAGKGNVLWGVLLLLLYSVGNGALAVICGTSIGLVKKLSGNERLDKAGNIIKIILGMLILSLAFYLFYLAF